VLPLRTHRQTRLFLRKDIYGRFMSCMVYLPRDRYTTAVRLRIQEILRQALHGRRRIQRHGRRIGAGPAARGGRAEPGTSLPDVDAAALEARCGGRPQLGRGSRRRGGPGLGEEPGPGAAGHCSGTIPENYKTDVPAPAALNDFIRVGEMLRSGEDTAFELWEAESYTGGRPVTSRAGTACGG
jgi:glutamate dehydrogenase